MPKKNSSVATQGHDNLRGTALDELIEGLLGNDTIDAGSGNDLIHGDAAAGPLPTITGVFAAPPGNNWIDAGAGNDTVYGGFGRDTIFGGSGNDVISGAGIASRPANPGGGGFNTFGFDGADYLDGGAGDDVLAGHGGRDTLVGGSGDDTLIGGTNADILTGGSGADVFKFGWAPREGYRDGYPGTFWFDAGVGAGNRDIITDFKQEHGDKIDLHQYLAYTFNPFPYDGPGELLADGRAVFLGLNGELDQGAEGWLNPSSKTTFAYAYEGGNTVVKLTAHIFPEASFERVPLGEWMTEIELVGRYNLTSSDFVF